MKFEIIRKAFLVDNVFKNKVLQHSINYRLYYVSDSQQMSTSSEKHNTGFIQDDNE